MSAWLYYFYHVMSFSKTAWGPDYPECYNVTCHGEELVYLFGSVDLAAIQLGENISYTASEKDLVVNVEDSWLNFINGNSPQPNWEPIGNSTLSSWLFSTPDSPMHVASSPIDFPRSEKCDFFDRIGYGPAQRFMTKLVEYGFRMRTTK